MGILSSKELRSIKDESRLLLKKCFKNPIFSLLPFEIWRDLIVCLADLKSIVLLSQTCFAFKEIVDEIGEKNFNLALLLRRACQIDIARRYLLKSAKSNNSIASFHLGYAFENFGWGLKEDHKKSVVWFKISAEHGNPHAMAFYARDLKVSNEKLSNIWAEKALSSNESFAIGFCHYHGLSVKQDRVKAHHCFEASANEGDEFGQYQLAQSFYYGHFVLDLDKALSWFLKSAEQGLYISQRKFVNGCSEGYGPEWAEKRELAVIWRKKMNLQLLKEKGKKN